VWPELEPFAGPVGIGTVVLAAIWMVLTGRLIPARTHEREIAAKQAEIDRLSAALEKVEAQRDKLMGLAGEVTVGIVRAIPSARDSVP